MCPQFGDNEVVMEDENATVFSYVQQLVVMGAQHGRADRLKRIWEPTYTYVVVQPIIRCRSRPVCPSPSHRYQLPMNARA